jgi:hypothetical protein
MTAESYRKFCVCRESFRKIAEDIERDAPDLRGIQQRLVDTREGPRYTVDTSAVYNTALDGITAASDIRLILAGDNPGRREQAAENRRYLVGPSGKIAESFFKAEPSLGIDFRENVIIVNKTPVHTPRTADLRQLRADGGAKIGSLIDASQERMAALTGDFFNALGVPVWITGYSEMRRNGVFAAYTDALKRLLAAGTLDRDAVFLYRHFSMNQFTADLRKKRLPTETAACALRRIGTEYRDRILFN